MDKTLALYFLLLITSCNNSKNDIYNELKGNWAIHKILYNDINYKNKIFSMNIINIKDDGGIVLPAISNYKRDKFARVNILNTHDPLKIYINSENKFFNGEYDAKIIESNLTDILILQSKNIYLELHKL